LTFGREDEGKEGGKGISPSGVAPSKEGL